MYKELLGFIVIQGEGIGGSCAKMYEFQLDLREA